MGDHIIGLAKIWLFLIEIIHGRKMSLYSNKKEKIFLMNSNPTSNPWIHVLKIKYQEKCKRLVREKEDAHNQKKDNSQKQKL